MLEMVDKVLCWTVPAIFYILFIGGAVIGVIGIAACFFSKSSLKEKLNILGACLVLIAVCFFFLGWAGQPWTEEDVKFAAACNPDFPDYSWVPVIVAGFFGLLTLVPPLVLRAFGVPMIFVGILYIGILIFGL